MKMLRNSAPENHIVEGRLGVAGTPKNMRVEALKLGTTGPEHLYLEAGGTVKEIEGTYEYEGYIASGASDISVLRSLFGIKLPPFGTPLFEGQIRGSMKKASFEGRVRLGSSRFRTTLSHFLTKQRPRVTATVLAPTVYLADVGVYPEFPEDLSLEIAPEPQSGDRLFSDKPLPFDALKAIDLSVSVAADNVVGKDFVLKNLNVDMLLKDGKLQIAPATVTYRNGSASIDFTIDTVGSKPEMALKVTAEDVDIGALSAYLHKAPSLLGQLNLVIALQSSGKSAREMATALKGEFGVAVEKGKIKQDIELMAQDAVDFLAAMRSSSKYSELRCMALRFVFEKGIGESEIIYLETPDMYAVGRAYIDLRTETMRMVLQPKPKKALPGLTSAVTIEGPIDNPKVRKLPFQEAAKLYGEIAMPMVFLPARGLGYLWYLIRKDAPGESPCIGMRPENNNLDEAR
ncbi:MAG TPA: AsmA family protein [Desulfobacterales bacterium]|nr:AsmA family protein [Desulfobacterales bacterium]